MPESNTGSSRRWLLRGALTAALVAGLFGLRATLLAPDPVPVRVAAVERGAVEATVTNSKAGTIRARRRSHVTAEIGGRVVEIAHREGERVALGALLVRLDDATFRAQVELARQDIRVAEAKREEACLGRDRAGRELARHRRLAEEKIASADRLDALQYASDAAKVACTAAAATLARAAASLTAARAELQKTLILAPFSGVVAEVASEVGEWVTPSPPLLTSPAVVDLIELSALYVSAPMDEVDSDRVRAGQRVMISVDSRPGADFPGRVVRVAPYVLDRETQNRTVEIEVEFDDGELGSSFLPGTSADVEVVLERRDDVLRIPTSALLEGNRVLVLSEDHLEERLVELGLRNWQYAELTSGLAAGDNVVTSLDRVETTAGARAVLASEVADSAP